jgi:hypothetical protein
VDIGVKEEVGQGQAAVGNSTWSFDGCILGGPQGVVNNQGFIGLCGSYLLPSDSIPYGTAYVHIWLEVRKG